MNSAVEQGIKNFLIDQLDAIPETLGEGAEEITVIAATISGQLVSLHCDVANDSMPELLPWIIIGARDMRHVVGELYTPEITIGMSTPQNREGITESTHRSIVEALRAIWVEANAADLSAAVLAAANCSADSWFIESLTDSLGGSRWQTEMKLKLCLLEQ